MRFLLDLDGVKNVTIKDKSYPGRFSIDQSGRFDGLTIYSISIADAGHKVLHEIQIIVRFDDSDKVRAVAGFYVTRGMKADGKEASDIIRARTFVPVFERVMIEDLPSSK
ncbi:MAG TPA: hypothetical protein VEG32_05655 [Clostridia bacterium]|nr:hypothetical protein [Clostridia bacterium]